MYIGVAKKRKYGNLKHRIESYNEKDDPREHPTKVPLRPRIKKFTYASVPITQARLLEKMHKNHTPFNMDENIGKN